MRSCGTEVNVVKRRCTNCCGTYPEDCCLDDCNSETVQIVCGNCALTIMNEIRGARFMHFNDLLLERTRRRAALLRNVRKALLVWECRRALEMGTIRR